MIQTKKNKFNKVFLLLLFFAIFCFAKPLNIKAQSADAIAVRIVENPLHYSSLNWYESQNFEGSPQLLDVDGYDAVRNGRTVYVNVANVIDKNNDNVPDFLYTNILILSYDQEAQGNTLDIFGQLLKNFKFNTNISSPGVCSKTTTTVCLSDSSCLTGEYCNSLKAKVIRDVKRLADLRNIKTRLDNYKQKYSRYPTMSAGTYISNITVSSWPSWQQGLGRELGVSLPIDPINTLGYCPGFDPITCWNEKTQKFAADLASSILPSGSHVYAYKGDVNGKTASYCAQMESNFENIGVFNCFIDKQANNRPTIDNVNLIGKSMLEFTGYVSVSDRDGDPVKLTVDLVSPDSATWSSRRWLWDSGLNKFSVISVSAPGQKKIHALRTGNVGAPGYYKIRLTVDDGRGESNSSFSQVYDVSVNPIPMTIDKADQTIAIGGSSAVTLSGTDGNGDPLTNIVFKDAKFNTDPISLNTLGDHGFSISGMAVNETYKSAQRTGVYAINVSSIDPSIPTTKIDSTATFVIVNHPPVFQKLTATFSNNTTKDCNSGDACSISIDNGEAAKIAIIGSDPDGHTVSYSLVDRFNNKLSINPDNGVISGFENLNFHNLTDQNFNIVVKISDEYCSNSSDDECSSTYSFNFLVEKYCSVDIPESMSHINPPSVFQVLKSGEALDTGISLNDCSAVGSSTVDVKFVGESHNQAIVLVSDLSKSMDTNIQINNQNQTAVSRLISALNSNNTGFLDQIDKIAKKLPEGFFIKIGLVAYNSIIRSPQPLVDIEAPNNLATLKSIVSNYTTDWQTNTLLGLNKAEEILAPITDKSIEKIVILMSDGIPVINGYKDQYYCYTPQCNCGTNASGACNSEPLCNNDQTFKVLADGTCDGCYTPPPVCYCGKNASGACNPWVNCYASNNERLDMVWYVSCKCVPLTCEWNDSCTTGTYPACELIDSAKNCSNGYNYSCQCNPNSAFNNLLKKFIALFKIFTPHPALAITNQTQCKSNCPNYVGTTTCTTNQQTLCYYNQISDCDMTMDVATQAKALKDHNVNVYTIYYNTGNKVEPKQKMCDWSSNNGLDCDNNTYSFSGTDINNMITKVLTRVVTKPKDVALGGFTINDHEPALISSQTVGAEINGLSCGPIKPIITYNNNGYLEFSNLQLNYCEAKLHS